MKSPFKFLDSYTKQDRDIFFGRETEIEEIHSKTFSGKILVVFGSSGTGKSSIIQCGLANRFSESDWQPITIRRTSDLNIAFWECLQRSAITPMPARDAASTESYLKAIRSIYLDQFKPIFLIFDQFEEVFIFGDEKERHAFAQIVSAVCNSNIPVKFIFIIRGEYLQYLSEIEAVIPTFFLNRYRVENMSRSNARNCILGPCQSANIVVEDGFAENLLSKLEPNKADVELTFLQVYLDRIYNQAVKTSQDGSIVFTNRMLEGLGDVGDILSDFLEEQLDLVTDKERTVTLLKAFISMDGTKKAVQIEEVVRFAKVLGSELSIETAENIVHELVDRRILQDKDEAGRYELKHDSLAQRVFHKLTAYEKDLIDAQAFINYAYNESLRRGFLLNESDLNYIRPFLDKIPITPEQHEFIQRSERTVRRTKRGRIQLYSAILIVGTLLVVSLYFLYQSIEQEARADQMAQVAIDESTEAKKQREIAEVQRSSAILSAQEAERQKAFAEKQRKSAEDQQALAERLRILADQQKMKADSARVQAIASLNTAQQNAIEAQQQRMLAEIERKKADTLRMLSLAQSLSNASLNFQDLRIRVLLAIQAYRFNSEFKGPSNQPDIFSGIYWARRLTGGINYNSSRVHSGPVRAIAAGPHEFFSAGGDGRIARISQREPGKLTTDILYQTGKLLTALAISKDGDRLFAGSDDGTLTILSNPPGAEQTIKLQIPAIHRICVSDQLPQEVIVCGDQEVIAINIQSQDQRILYKSKATINTIELDPDFGILVGAANGNVLAVLPTTGTIKDLFTLTDDVRTENPVQLASSPEFIGVGTESGLLALYHKGTGTWLRPAAHRAAITSLEFSRDGNTLLSSSMDGRIYINYNFYSASKPVVLDDHESWVMTAHFLGPQNDVVSGDGSGTVRYFSSNIEMYLPGLCTSDLTEKEWQQFVGKEIPYRKTCN